jgi:hypothetical protein
MWSVDYAYIVSWLNDQNAETIASIFAALELLEQHGPNLGRPLVDTLVGATMKNLKELRPASPGKTEIRILFVFDPTRRAILLFAGDKSTGKKGNAQWSGWYKRAIPRAENLYRQHIEKLGENNG